MPVLGGEDFCSLNNYQVPAFTGTCEREAEDGVSPALNAETTLRDHKQGR
jgi:hypothetical protein